MPESVAETAIPAKKAGFLGKMKTKK